MKKESVIRRRDDLKKGVLGLNQQIETLKSQLEEKETTRNATHGAILECSHWLEELEKEELPVELKEVVKEEKGKSNGKS